MKQIVIISGKGGTGKTSITASLAKLCRNSVIADCDVDASNLHMLLEPVCCRTEKFYSGYHAFIDKDRCAKCDKCIDSCRFNAIDNYHVSEIFCEGCGYCKIVCPENAIELKKAYRGVIHISNTRLNMPLVHTEMEIGAQNSGKLVAYVKSTAQKIADEKKLEYILVDGSPGIGCPVIASLIGADIAVIVTEPTSTAKSDMVRLHKLINSFDTNTAIIINKSDINKKVTAEIVKYSKANNITVLGYIPHSTLFHKALAENKIVTEFNDKEIEESINIVWANIINLLNN
jgi:MinD superfamily P-loop ATPase